VTKAAVFGVTCLSHPDPNLEVLLALNVSDSHLGTVLQQAEGSGWRLLAFFSKKVQPAQLKYSAFDRELLVAFLAVRHFHFLLEGWTDNKSLAHDLHHVSEPCSSRQQCQLAYLAESTADIRHIAGQDNFVADTLS
jgi:hypothetical protein